MDISEMHVWFRQYAQQMGMQNVRTILDEQIDILLNTSITDTVNRILKENVTSTNDKVDLTNTKIGQINAFTNLYKTVGVGVSFNGVVEGKNKKYEVSIPDNIEPFLYTSFSLQYAKGADKSPIYKIRLIDEPLLANTVNDYILRPKFNSPICCIANDNIILYVSKDTQGYDPAEITISYIKKPAIVKLDLQDSSNNVSCDLPDYLHADIVKHASNLYISTLFGPRGGRPYPFEENNNNSNNQ